MEQVYVIKLKELPKPVNNNNNNNYDKSSPLEGKDLSRRSLFGLSVFQLVLGLLCIVFSLLGATRDWTHSFGILVGVIYTLTGMTGTLSAENQGFRFSGSRTFLYFSIGLHCLSLLISCSFILLTLFGVICKLSSSMNLQTSLITANLLEFVFALLSGFTCCRIIWPEFLQSWIHGWPDAPKIGTKMIVKTSIYPSRGLTHDNFSRYLGPNCIVSLVPPQPPPPPPTNDGDQPPEPCFKNGNNHLHHLAAESDHHNHQNHQMEGNDCDQHNDSKPMGDEKMIREPEPDDDSRDNGDQQQDDQHNSVRV